MKQEIIKQMTEIVRDTMRGFQSDFEYDKKLLADYDGKFIWQVCESHTHISLIDAEHILHLIQSERGIYLFAQKAFDPDYLIPCISKDELVFYYDGYSDVMEPITKREAEHLWAAIRDGILCAYKAQHGSDSVPTNFRVPIKFNCKVDYVVEQLAFAKSIGTNSLIECFKRLRCRMKLDSFHHIEIGRDFAEHSFTFASYCMNGDEVKCDINGGIIYYDGAWHTHT